MTRPYVKFDACVPNLRLTTLTINEKVKIFMEMCTEFVTTAIINTNIKQKDNLVFVLAKMKAAIDDVPVTDD